MTSQASHFYRLLLRFYPSQYRQEYTAPMLQTFNDLYRQKIQRQPSVWGWIRFWAHILSDTVISASLEHYYDAKEHGMKNKGFFSLVLVLFFGTILFYLLLTKQNIDFAAIYFCVLITGAIVWAMSKAGLQRYNPLWSAYTKGTLIGTGAVLVMVFSTMNGIDIIVQQGDGWVNLTFATCIYLLTLLLIHRYVKKGLGKVFWLATIALPVISALALWLRFSSMSLETINSEIMGYYPVSLAFSTLQILVIIAIGALSIYHANQNSRTSAISMIVSSGMIYAAFYPNISDTELERMADWLMILFPLILCPLCWLAIKSPNVRLVTTFGLWGFMVLMIELTPMLATGTFGFYLLRGDTLGTSHLVTTVIPLLVMIWIVLQRASNPAIGAESKTYGVKSPAMVSDAKR